MYVCVCVCDREKWEGGGGGGGGDGQIWHVVYARGLNSSDYLPLLMIIS